MVTSYCADENLRRLVEVLLPWAGPVIVVDDGSPEPLDPGPVHEWVRHAQNAGVAAALNSCLRVARRAGATHVVTFDQDSMVDPQFLAAGLVDAARAYEIGLVNRVVDAGDVLDTAVELAERIGDNGPLGVAAVKEIARLVLVDTEQANARQRHWQKVVFSSEDAKEGATAFVEKRPPVWKGR